MSVSRTWRSSRAVRVPAALLIVALLAATRYVVPWIESAYPLPDGIVQSAAKYVLITVMVVCLAALALGAWLAPAWAVARSLYPDDPPPVRVLRATVTAFLLQPLVNALVVMGTRGDLAPDRLGTLHLAVQAVLLLVVALLPARTATTSSQGTRTTKQRPLLIAAFVLGITMLLLPGIAWEDYNPDGIEMLTLGRSIAWRAVPRLWSGEIPPTDLGMFMAAFPVGWLVSLGGAGEIAGRLPVIGYAVALAAGVLALAEQGTKRLLSSRSVAALLAGCGALVLTLTLNTAYDPYSTDVASPAAIDLLALVFFLATLYFIFENSVAWALASAALMSLTRPTALLLFGLLVLAVVVVERDWSSPRLRLAVMAVGAALLVAVLHSAGRGEAAEGGMLSRIRYLRFDDWARLRFLIVPSGILPVITWIAWRKLDANSRILALVAIGYFAFFSVMAFYALHHFAPAMLLPLVTFWRNEERGTAAPAVSRRWVVWSGIALALLAALPRDFTPYRESRRIGEQLSYEIGDYLGDFDGIRQAFAGSDALGLLFAAPWIADPHAERITQPYTFIHYAALGRKPSDPLYVARTPGAAVPVGTSRVGVTEHGAMYVRDSVHWRQHRSTPPPPASRSPWYDVPRTTLFPHLGLAAGLAQLDLFQAARRVRAMLRGSAP